MTDPKQAKCFDKDWRYTPANSTDIAKTFARIRRQQKEVEAVKASNVRRIAVKGK